MKILLIHDNSQQFRRDVAVENRMAARRPQGGSSWEINPREIEIGVKLGEGSFGDVRKGIWNGKEVAVKIMKSQHMSSSDFKAEAQIMMNLQHQNVISLYGFWLRQQPVYIVTEFMKHGALLSYLKKNKFNLFQNPQRLLNAAVQVCDGMAYLERHSFVHRDLAARNCLVGSDQVVKVADFGLTRYVDDEIYSGSTYAVFATRWSPPEVISYKQFSSKSDVWSFGVLLWEIYTGGVQPYGNIDDIHVRHRILEGNLMRRPKNCPSDIYEEMKKCWKRDPDDRPSFRRLKEKFAQFD